MSDLYSLLRPWTMVPEVQFRENLRLAETVREVPGNVTEAGTWKGGMLAALAARTGRRAVGLDGFRGLPPAGDVDGPAARAWQANVAGPDYHNNCRASRRDVEEALERAAVADYAVAEGWVEHTLPRLEVEPIAILRIDVDWYEATLLCLNILYPRVVPGGLVILDDYAAWDGCALAVHRFLDGRAERLMMDERWVAHFYRRKD